MENIERKFTDEECLKYGGHFWKYYNANTIVDPLTFEPTGQQTSVYYPNGEPQYRACPLCGKKERLIPAHWEEA